MIIGLFGSLGSTKTIGGVHYCHSERLRGKKIISNIKLNFPYEKIDLEGLFKIAFSENVHLKKEFFGNSVLFLDEIHNIVDARKSTSNLNTYFTQFVTQIGKLDCTLIFTSQIFTSQIDLRIRELCNVIGTCFKLDKETGQILIFTDRIAKKPILACIYFEVVMFGLDNPNNPKAIYTYDPEPYFNMYDTREIVLLDREKFIGKRRSGFI